MLRERKFEFAAWMVYEVGKNWAEADADMAETIDFAEFYAREALRLAQAKTPTQLPGEADRLIYIPLGVAAVIPPWNFPLRDHGRHDHGRDCDRQHRGDEALARFSGHCREVL